MTILDRLAKRYDRRLLEQMIYLPAVPADAIDDAKQLILNGRQNSRTLWHIPPMVTDARIKYPSKKPTRELASLEIQARPARRRAR